MIRCECGNTVCPSLDFEALSQYLVKPGETSKECGVELSEAVVGAATCLLFVLLWYLLGRRW